MEFIVILEKSVFGVTSIYSLPKK